MLRKVLLGMLRLLWQRLLLLLWRHLLLLWDAHLRCATTGWRCVRPLRRSCCQVARLQLRRIGTRLCSIVNACSWAAGVSSRSRCCRVWPSCRLLHSWPGQEASWL